MYVLGRLLAIDQGYYMRMMQAFENRYLGRQVVFELLVELVQGDRFDCNKGLFTLRGLMAISKRQHGVPTLPRSHKRSFWASHGNRDRLMTHCMNSLVNRSKATLSNLFHFREATYLTRVAGAFGSR